MNIDAKIQEILLRSSPVNDNGFNNNSLNDKNTPHINGISIVGNKNVVIYSNMISSLIALSMAYLFAFYFR